MTVNLLLLSFSQISEDEQRESMLFIWANLMQTLGDKGETCRLLEVRDPVGDEVEMSTFRMSSHSKEHNKVS